jgi:hypothetical protein
LHLPGHLRSKFVFVVAFLCLVSRPDFLRSAYIAGTLKSDLVELSSTGDPDTIGPGPVGVSMQPSHSLIGPPRAIEMPFSRHHGDPPKGLPW